MPTTKRKKEDLVRVGKAVGQTKLSFAKKSKTIDEVNYLLLYSDHQQSYFFQFKTNRSHCVSQPSAYRNSFSYVCFNLSLSTLDMCSLF